MKYRKLGRTNFGVSDIAYGLWGMGGWSGSEDRESLAALQLAVDLGCTFFDTAWVYGMGRSEKLLGQALRARSGAHVAIATKIPPKNMRWPGSAQYPISSTYPSDHIRQYPTGHKLC